MAITVKHKFVSAIPDGTDATIVRPSNWNDDHDLTGTIPVTNGGTGAATASDGLNNLLPSQTGNNGKVLATDGTNASWTTNGSGDVVGPSSATDNAIARFDGTTGKLIQNSGVTVDDNSNITANNLFEGFSNTAASGTQIVLTAASVPSYVITGSGGQTIKLPDATTLPNGTTFSFNNNQSSGAISVNNNSNTLVVSIPSGAFTIVTLLSNSIAAGSWDTHDQAPANVSWSTNTFSYAGSFTNGTWNGNTVQVNRGGTGTTTSTGTGSVVLNTSPTLTTPAITGGTIDNTVIGATTPAAGTFTTITGQTEVLKGTGSNLLLQSNTFTTTWTTGSATWTSGQTDPFSGSNGWLLTASGANNFYQSIFNTVNGITYTFSIYAKANSLSSFSVPVQLTGVVFTPTFNLSAGTVASTGTGTASITSVGNGWYRCVATATSTAAGTAYFQVNYAGAGTLYFYAAQAEVGTSANAYTATTTSLIYGTPTLSFSGVAGLGLESNGALYVSPAGTGALQAQATTSSTVGGNARGANAVDWQTSRNSAGQVASGSYAFLGGGDRNIASVSYAFVGGGFGNSANNNVYGTVVGGNANTAGGYISAIVGGNGNTAAGYYNFIGGGFTNSATSGSAVTTQSGTMNATTAVTLSGSNANIKVGQYITGTSIANQTYVAAISGTSLTLSQAASGSSTSTLSFYTPHGVVVGGGNNQATGSYSFIGGGGDAGTAANRNVASGDWSFVGGGQQNTASGIGSFIGGGGQAGANAASGQNSMILGGASNIASSSYSTVLGGLSSTSNSVASISMGRQATTRSVDGIVAMASSSAPIGSTVGSAQTSILVLARQTTDATATVLASNSSGASGSNQVILPNNSAYYFTGEVISGVTAGGDSKGWSISGVIKRGANAGATTLVGSTVTSLYADAGAATWTIGLTADTTNGGLKVTFTGQASTTIRTVCQIRTTEMTY